jgi:plastocyanin/FtsP/CotA-like multicopper oxidase with cupredoxin domain
MATVEFWIQIENHAWDASPHNVDRISGQTIQQVTQQMFGTAKNPVVSTLTSPVTGSTHTQQMFNALSNDALIYRRYTANWATPDDHKVNPWDQNELDPTDTGTMGTIPGAVLECNVGDTMIVHFRNMDNRTQSGVLLPIETRTHSLHPHGIVFAPTSDGAFPLSPPDTTQPVGGEATAWAGVGVTNFKQGDRVPPAGTYTYTWETHGWPSTAGVWLYHDHSICDDESVQQGAIGLIVVHNTQDPQDVETQDLPGGSFVGSPIHILCFPINLKIPVSVQELDRLEGTAPTTPGQGMAGMKMAETSAQPMPAPEGSPPTPGRTLRVGEAQLELDEQLTNIIRFCLPLYQAPPSKAQYLLLFHTLGDVGMCINGRQFLGNTPTLVSGPTTKMRFGIIGMMSDFHTFHLHGHRWTIPGPDGITPGNIQTSPQIRAVSQFEDTRTFGPANSFSFTIDQDQGSFMGAFPGQAIGEWHLHCHVQSHMMQGMMGSLKIVNGGALALSLPVGKPCPPTPAPGTNGGTGTVPVNVVDNAFVPANVMITKGQTVLWTNNGNDVHTVTSNPGPSGCNPSSAEAFASSTLAKGNTFSHLFNQSGSFSYHCEVHGCSMAGTVTVM